MIDHTIFSSHKALFHTFGCKLNFAETSTVARTLAEHGIMRCQRGDVPDIVVINPAASPSWPTRNAARPYAPTPAAIPMLPLW
mgnify:CR=1 FL=1